jgi:hypothetical protein
LLTEIAVESPHADDDRPKLLDRVNGKFKNNE